MCICTNKTKQYYHYRSIDTFTNTQNFILVPNITQTFIYYIIIVIILKFTLCYFPSKQNNNNHVLDLCVLSADVRWENRNMCHEFLTR